MNALPRAYASRADTASEVVARLAEQAKPGQRLGTRSELRERAGVSVGTFNEAMRLLVSQQVVTVRPGPGGGVFAAETPPMVRLGNAVLALNSHPELVSHAIQLRDVLDPLVVDEAIRHAGPPLVAKLKERCEEMRDAVDRSDTLAFLHANWAMHADMCGASPNVLLREIYLNVMDVIREHTLDVRPLGDQPVDVSLKERLKLHERLVEAIADRDRHAAAEIVAEHTPAPSQT